MNRSETAWRALLALLLSTFLIASCTDAEPGEPPEASGEGETEPPAEDDESDDESDDEEDEEDSPTELEERLDEIAEQVSVLRELPLLDDIDSEVLEPDDLAEVVTEHSIDAESLERTAGIEQVLIALRHLPEGSDLQQIYDDLLAASVVGLYDPEESIAYISSEAEPLSPAAASTAAHELLHALQDQHFDLTRLDDIPSEDGDSVLAFLSVIEGDAVILEEEWAASHQSEEEREEAEREQTADVQEQAQQLQEAPSYIVESFIFPYVAGERFIATLINEGGYDAVDEALEDPPTTTLEILDPDQYLQGDFSPVEVGAGTAPGDGWEEGLTSSFGAFDVLALFGSTSAQEAVQGSTAWPAWRGGKLRTWERDDDITVAVGLSFDDAERAETVCTAVTAWYEDVAEASEDGDVWQGDRDVLALDCDDTDVTFSLAPDGDTARAALGVD